MIRILGVLLVLLCGVFGGGAASADDQLPPYVDETVAGWRQGPVHLSPDSGAITPDQAAALASRIDGWREDVFLAVVPAVSLGGDDGPSGALEFLDAVHDELGRDGVYVVLFSGASTYGAAYGTNDRVGSIVADQVTSHTLGQGYAILDGTLDELGAPGSAGAGSDGHLPGWLLAVAGAAALVALVAGAFLLGRRRRGTRRLPSGETWGPEAQFRPGHTVYVDNTDTVEERAALAREDVTRLGEEIQRDDLPVTDPAVAAHVQAGLDAYDDASRQVDELTSDDELRELGDIVAYARWRLACAKAVLEGAALPARRVPCFRDPGHGVSVTDVVWQPPGGAKRPVPVCRACFDQLNGGVG